MRQKIQLVLIYTLILITLLVQASCKASAAATDHVTRSTLLLNASEEPAATTAASDEATSMEATEAAATATALQVATTVVPAATTVATTKDTAAPTSTPQETTAASTTAATTAAATAVSAVTTAATTTAPAYFPNADNIRNLIIADIQAQGKWLPDAAIMGGGSAKVPTDYYLSDEAFAGYYLSAKFKPEYNDGCTSLSVIIEGDYVLFSSTSCALPSA